MLIKMRSEIYEEDSDTKTFLIKSWIVQIACDMCLVSRLNPDVTSF